MHLWNEYEGRTIAGSYTLDKLLRSEGRNGFFSTSTDKGSSAVIRVTEAHFDEEEQLKRWRQVAEVHQTNLIEIEGMGKTTFDGVALTYALMEPNDANLGDVLKERPLTPAETLEVAKSVLAAVKALHASGLVHEHIEPSNVLAVGDVVKLRSDCVRECVADVEFNTPEGCAELRKRDLHDYGILLLQCLTLEKEWTADTSVPEPFRRVIPGAIGGTMSLEQIASIIDPGSAHPLASPALRATTLPPLPPATYGTGASIAAGRATTPPLVPPAVRETTAAHLAARSEEVNAAEPSLRRRSYTEDEEPTRSSQVSMGTIWAVCGVSALLLVLLIWHLVGGKSNKPVVATTPAPVAQTAPSGAAAPAAVGSSVPRAAAPAVSPEAPAPDVRTVSTGPGWYVIAFTFNHAAQAQTKADRINRRHAGLHAEVFSPTGHAPYLIALNGPMGQGEAEATWRRARRSGMPRDTFVRHY